MSNIAASKAHTSPSKGSYGRTYDSKVVSREMHRLGANLAHLPAALSPAIGGAAASSVASSLTIPSNATASSSSSTNDPWGALHVHVLPLFNGEPLSIPIEELNILVKRHIHAVVPLAPNKAIATLEHDASELIASGMVTLNAKLVDVKDEKLVSRVVETWGFFWDQVLTYVEGVLLPMQTDPLLSSLYRTPKSHRSSSPTRPSPKGSISTSLSNLAQITANQIDVRTIALCSFRDKVILPFANRLANCLSGQNRQESFLESGSYQQPRLQQMLLVLASQNRQIPPTFSLTASAAQLTPGEMAVASLLRLVRSPHSQAQMYRRKTVHAPTFFSGGAPRDRRGRIGEKVHIQKPSADDEGDSQDDDEVFRAQNQSVWVSADADREREREFLEVLRSAEVNHDQNAGGWGLGAGHEENGKNEEDEEDETPWGDWDQAQAAVEKMVGMNSSDLKPDSRRKMV